MYVREMCVDFMSIMQICGKNIFFLQFANDFWCAFKTWGYKISTIIFKNNIDLIN